MTDGDFRCRAVGSGMDMQLPVTSIMSSPLQTGSEILTLAVACSEMKRAGIGHLVIVDAAGKIRGIVGRRDYDDSFFQPQAFSVKGEAGPPPLDDLRIQFLKLPELLDVFVRSHARSEWLTGLTTANADRSAEVVAEIAGRELGPAPVPFAFFVLGSEGRSESTLFTDQDNALVHPDSRRPGGIVPVLFPGIRRQDESHAGPDRLCLVSRRHHGPKPTLEPAPVGLAALL